MRISINQEKMDLLREIKELKTLIQRSEIYKKEILTFEDATKYLNVSSSYLYKLTSKNEIPFCQPTGKRIYFRRTEIDEWVFNSKVESVSDIENEVEHYLSRTKKTSLW